MRELNWCFYLLLLQGIERNVMDRYTLMTKKNMKMKRIIIIIITVLAKIQEILLNMEVE